MTASKRKQLENDDEGLLVVCRDIPGQHTGGQDCFCCPVTFTMDASSDEIMSRMEVAGRMN